MVQQAERDPEQKRIGTAGDLCPPPPPASHLLVTGGTTVVPQARESALLHMFPPSFNSGKACFCLQISSAGASATVSEISIVSQNYELDFARINRNMTVPVLEIDDKIITDSRDIALYLMQQYPGEGDREAISRGDEHALLEFIDLIGSWDEYMFTYGHMGPTGNSVNGLRLVNLRSELLKICTQSGEDKEQLIECYCEKIGHLTIMNESTSTPDQSSMQQNKQLLDTILKRGSDLLSPKGSSDCPQFLFGKLPTSADGYFLCIFRLLNTMYPAHLQNALSTHPNLAPYWEHCQTNLDVQQGLLKYTHKPHLVWFLVKSGVLFQNVCYKLGLWNAGALPKEIEAKVQDAIVTKRKQLRGPDASAPVESPPSSSAGAKTLVLGLGVVVGAAYLIYGYARLTQGRGHQLE